MGERVAAEQAIVVSPGHRAGVVTPAEPVLPNPVHTSLEARETTAVSRNPIVRVTAPEFECELSVLIPDGIVQVFPAPLPDCV